MCVGILRHDEIVKGKASGVGNIVIIAGSATGRDGIHGASFASEELEEAETPTMQAGDPYIEKLLMEACLELFKTDAVVGVQDLGACRAHIIFL